MRREKKRLEAVEKYLRQRERLHEKRQRKNSSPETTQPGYLGDDAGGRNPHEGTRRATEIAAAGFNQEE